MRRSRLRRAAGPEATITTAVRCAVGTAGVTSRQSWSEPLGLNDWTRRTSSLSNPWNKVRFAGRTLGRCGNCYG
jgi:hypothetical protein